MKKKYQIISETEKTITFKYDGCTCCFAKKYSSIEKEIQEIEEDRKKMKEAELRIAAQRAAMTPEQRASQDEADRVIFERWQDEANTNLYLAGLFNEGEDPDFNPFRKD